jgi:hypothetical protein
MCAVIALARLALAAVLIVASGWLTRLARPALPALPALPVGRNRIVTAP